jgi:hypothetical protein
VDQSSAVEKRQSIEAPQNYGFTSTTTDADQNQSGGGQSSGGSPSGGGGSGQATQDGLTDGPETFVMFVGGNRSFPVAFPIDDRRNRLQNLKPGDVAMYRLQLDRQQIHMVVDPDRKYYGTYWSTRDDRVNRCALVPQPSQQQQEQQATTYGGNAKQPPPNPQKGQQDCLDDNVKSKMYWELNSTHFQIEHNNSFIEVTDDYIHAYNGNGHVYITNDYVETYYNDDTISTKVDADHAHIRCKNFATWVNKGGCYCTVRPVIAQDPDA